MENVTLVFSIPEADLVLKALSEAPLPWKETNALINNIMHQARTQNEPKSEPPITSKEEVNSQSPQESAVAEQS